MSWAETAAVLSPLIAVAGVLLTSIIAVAKFGRVTGIMETSIRSQNETLGELKGEFKEIRTVITQIAVQTDRLNTFSAAMQNLTRRVDDMARGEGFIVPFKPRS